MDKDDKPEQVKHQVKLPPHQQPLKQFQLRNSVLTNLFAVNNFQAVEHLFLCMFIYIFFAKLVSSYIDGDGTLAAFLPTGDFLPYAFANYTTAILVWLRLMAMALGFYLLVRVWHFGRKESTGGDFYQYDAIFTVLHFVYQAVFFYSTYDVLFQRPILGPAAATAIAMEQFRLFAKMHSFAREKLRHALSGNKQVFPTLTWYAYFLFVPTLLYRDTYPRSPQRRWRYVLLYFGQFAGCLASYFCIVDRYLLAPYAVLLSQPVTKAMIIKTIVNSFAPVLALHLLLFFGFFQCWLNLWGELLRFGDREFYGDFWNATNPRVTTRTWNVVIHDWLHAYVCRDSFGLLKGYGGGFLPTMIVFGVSAVFHEFIMVAMMHYWFPVMSVQVMIAGVTIATSKFDDANQNVRLENFKTWLNGGIGIGVVHMLFMFETAAKRLCGDDAHFWNCFPNSQ